MTGPQFNIDHAALLADVQENRRLLDGCKRHFFPTFKIGFRVKNVCANCGGAMDVLETSQYVRGYIAAGGNPDDVLPGWYKPIGPENQE